MLAQILHVNIHSTNVQIPKGKQPQNLQVLRVQTTFKHTCKYKVTLKKTCMKHRT